MIFIFNINFKLILILILINDKYCIKCYSIDEGRALILYPQYTILQISVCMTSPIELPNNENLAIGHIGLNLCLQANYNMPYTPTEFEHPPFWAQRSLIDVAKTALDNFIHPTHVKYAKRDLSAGQFYNVLENLIEDHGYHKECLLKSVCELAKFPLPRDDDDFLFAVINFILIPSKHQGFNETEHVEKLLYEGAENLGNLHGDCNLSFPDCDQSPLEYITHSFEVYTD